jgi:hypothetical protein
VDSTTLLSDTLAALGDSVNVDSIRAAKAADQFGIFHPASTGTGEEVVIENDRLQIGHQHPRRAPSVIRLKEYQTHNKTPLYLADPDSGNYEFRLLPGQPPGGHQHERPVLHRERWARTKCVFESPTTDPAKFLEITYQLDSTGYFMDTTCRAVGLENRGGPRNTVFNWTSLGLSNEKYRVGELQKSGVYYKYFSDDRNT